MTSAAQARRSSDHAGIIFTSTVKHAGRSTNMSTGTKQTSVTPEMVEKARALLLTIGIIAKRVSKSLSGSANFCGRANDAP